MVVSRDLSPKPEDAAVTQVGSNSESTRFSSMKKTASQHSFDTNSLDGSGLEDRLSVDSDGSDGFVMLMDSGNKNLFGFGHYKLIKWNLMEL